MEKFIKQYGILILIGVAVYWFFIREKDEVVVVDEGETSNLGGSDCPCQDNPSKCPTGCKDCYNCNPLKEDSSVRRGRGRRAQFKYPNFRYANRRRRVNI